MTAGAVEVAAGSRRVLIEPSATAMIWLGPDRPLKSAAFVNVTLEPLELLVEIELATICGSDVHTTRGARPAPTPLVLGHEQFGRIVAVGTGMPSTIDGEALAVGDRIVWSIAASCGECDRCSSGRAQKCRSLKKYGHERIDPRWSLSGGFATHIHLLAGTPIVRVPEDIPAEVLAPVSCGTATAWAALDAASEVADLDNADVLISGSGLIGLTATAMATDRGARVIVADPDPARRDLALRFGAVASYDPIASADEIGQMLAGFGVHDGFDVVVEASGSRAAVVGTLTSVAIGGAVILVGSVYPTEPVPLDPEWIVRRLLTIRGVHNYTADHLGGAVAYIADRWASRPFAELVGETVGLDQLDDGIRLSKAGGAVRIAVNPRG